MPSAARSDASETTAEQTGTDGASPSIPMGKMRLLSDQHADAARRFIQRRNELDPQARTELADRLARMIATELGVGLGSWPDAEAFLSEVVSCLIRARGGEDSAGPSARR